MINKEWFTVDRVGLKQLQLGKPKHYILRELIQNAWDEKVKEVSLKTSWKNGIAEISITDDSLEGFKDLTDAYTLFKQTSKRDNPQQRGRFNLGEKQVFSLCEQAIVSTTKGTIIFNSDGRQTLPEKTNVGSVVSVWIKMTKEEFDEMIEVVKLYLVPRQVRFFVNKELQSPQKVFKSFETKLVTEVNENGILKRPLRLTTLNLHKTDKSYLYELGIPICEIDCEFSIDVQQKIPLSVDRETIQQSYLQDLFSEVLNHTYEDIEEEKSSQNWIRIGMSDDRVNQTAVETILTKRFGDKVCVADPFDPNSVDEAISHGYRVIRGNEMSKEEWMNIKRFESLGSSSQLFGTTFTDANKIEPTSKMVEVAELAKKIAKRIFNISITTIFVSERTMVAAQFGNNTLTFNVAKLGKSFFENKLNCIDLIVHELGHYKGNHTEHDYHDAITMMAQELIKIALKEPEFFD